MKKLYRYLLYILPLVLCFSYFPVISLGENETMYFELSLPLLWLVIFDILGFSMVVLKYRRKIFTKIFGSFFWWLFPFFATFSIAWSSNPLRGVLTAGVIWLLFFAVLWFYELRENLDGDFWKIFWRWFFGSALFVCAWCVVQCVLDVCGVPQEATLLCDGCVYAMFGFPRPNGFAIEPQFMGNLLLAPIVVMTYFTIDLHSICNISGASRRDNRRLYSKNQNNRKASFSERSLAPVVTGLGRSRCGPSPQRLLKRAFPVVLFVLSTILFLTMSRGAIYAGAVGVIFLYFFMWARAKKSEKKAVCKNIMKTVGIFVLSFLFALNMQGIFAAVSPTSDTYTDGVAKVLNNLSLGVIDIKGTGEAEKTSAPASEIVPVENSEALVENSGGEQGKEDEKAVFDGYVEESTDTRVRLFNAALTIWRKDFKTVIVGVGLGGAGQALYDNGFSPAPREIVQNEYAELLLETGIVGVSLLIIILILAIRLALKNSETAGMILGLMVAYGVSLCFFSGLPNALHIILIPGLLYYMERAKKI